MEKVLYLKIARLDQEDQETGTPEVIYISPDRMPKEARYNTPLNITTDSGETIHCKILKAQEIELKNLDEEEKNNPEMF